MLQDKASEAAGPTRTSAVRQFCRQGQDAAFIQGMPGSTPIEFCVLPAALPLLVPEQFSTGQLLLP